MRYLDLGTKEKPLYLVEQEVAKPKAVIENAPTNHIWIFDTSGSMYGAIERVGEDLVQKSKEIPIGDTVTLGRFSGEGDRNFMPKGFKITADGKDREILERIIRKECRARGTTCFSEILGDTDQVVSDLSAISPQFSLMFLTDGYPVVSDYKREVESLNVAIAKVQGRIGATLLVGYGSYYNKELMSDMAARFGGVLTHSKDIGSFSVSMREFLEEVTDVGGKSQVKLDAVETAEDVAFSVGNRTVNVYQPTPGGLVDFSHSKRKRDFAYVLTKVLPQGDHKEVELTEPTVRGSTQTNEPMVKAAYAAAFILTQRTKTDKALEILGKLGDVRLVKRITNSYTNDEYGEAESHILKSMASPSKRLLDGYDPAFLPPADAFCLIDLLEELGADEEAYFYPTVLADGYKRIGAKSKAKEGYPEFARDADSRSPLSKLTWNQTMLNLSLQSRIEGAVDLGDEAEKLGLARKYPTHIYRNYAVVKDGFLNVPTLPVSVSEDTFLFLRKQELLDPSEVWSKGRVFHLDLTKVPVINRATAEGKTSAEKLCKQVLGEIRLQGQIKALKHVRDELEEKVPAAKDTFTAAQRAFLDSKGVKAYGFSPLTEDEEPTDFYMAKEFEIKVKGLSSLPKVEDVRKAVAAKKDLTPSQYVVFMGLTNMEAATPGMTQKVKLAWVNEKLELLQRALWGIRTDIQKTKFAVILGKRWFDEFTSREENTITVEGHVCTVSLREVKVEV